MNIYFTASTVGIKHYKNNYEQIVSLLKKKGHKVIYKHIIDPEESEAMRQARAKETRANYLQALEGSIAQADCMVVEGTYPSISVGFDISMALRLNKPVLLLYCEGEPPTVFVNSGNEKLLWEKYTTSNLEIVLDDFIHFAEGSSEIRFNFFITSKMAAFLDRAAEIKNIPKSVYLRKLIEREMRREK